MRRIKALVTGGAWALVLVASSPCGTEAPADSPPQAANGRPNVTEPVVLAPTVAEPETPALANATPTSQPAARRVAWPPTALKLVLLSTLQDPAGQSDRATIRDADSGVIASFRKGDPVRDGVVVLGVEDGVVELSNDGDVEYLSISQQPFELDSKDVFYPDLVDDLGTEMADGVQMPPGAAYVLKTPDNAWGTPRTVALLREAVRNYARDHDGPKVRIGDISRASGGPFPPHLSHQQGRDVDVGYILQGPRKDDLYFVNATPGNLDRERTWALLESMFATGEVTYIFMDYELQKLLYAHAEANGVPPQRLAEIFQYPNGRRASRGKIRHWRSHRGHFHVRFRR